MIGTSDYPCVRRDPTPGRGLALIGDACVTGDPVPATGCGWAFRTAEWLVDATTDALASHGDIDRALRVYRKQHRLVRRYDAIARKDARATGPNPVQRMLQAAAVHDDEIAHRLGMFAMCAAPVGSLLNPRTLLRAATTRPTNEALSPQLVD